MEENKKLQRSGNYKSWKKTVLSYGVFSLWVSASYLPLVITGKELRE